MRLSVAVAAVCLSIIGLAVADDVRASIRKPTNIAAQGLGSALQALAKDRNFQIVYVSEEINSLHSQGAVGEFSTQEALKQLLRGTGMTYRYLDEKTVTILRVSNSSEAAEPTAQAGSAGAAAPTAVGDWQRDDQVLSRLLVAQATVRGETGSGSSSVETEQGKSDRKSDQLQEVVVTAQKKSENLLSVPVPVTAISGEDLINQNQLRLQDFYTNIPGLTVVTGGMGSPQLTIRGLNTGGGNPTTALLIDDVPFGSSTTLGGGLTLADLDPSDISRVEVLRGPQGTLYGANSVGGLVKYVTVDPSTAELSGGVQAGGSDVAGGTGTGYNFRGFVNVPVSDDAAFRASAFSRKDPGYIDNINTGEDGVNRTYVEGGRLAGLWRLTDDLSLKVSALYQESRQPGPFEIYPSLGGPGFYNNDIPGADFYNSKAQAYSAILTAKLGGLALTSLTGYNVDTIRSSFDTTQGFPPGFINQYFPVNGITFPSNSDTHKFTQEFRLASPGGQWLDWLAGAFYTHEYDPSFEGYFAADTTTGQIAGVGLGVPAALTLSEYAAFTTLTFNLTDRLNIQLGGRESKYEEASAVTEYGPLVPVFQGLPSPLVEPTIETSASAFTYLLTPQFKFSPNFMAYARLASGYGPGGPNGSTTQILPAYGPEKTENYEIGTKGDFLDHTLSLDASVYYIKWQDIQVQIFDLAEHSVVYTNGSGAKSEGVEFKIDAKPLPGLTTAAWVAYDEAVLTAAFPPGAALLGINTEPGDRLPLSSKWSGNVSLQQDFGLTQRWNGFVGANVSYVGDRLGSFTGPGTPRQEFPAYWRTDLRAGVTDHSWTANLFVNNVGDNRGQVGGFNENTPPYLIYITPRTVGVNLTKLFF
jgi:iron complex outermembrane receptor protein